MTKLLANMVVLVATAQANTPVRDTHADGTGRRYLVYTDPNDREHSRLTLSRVVADQLVKAGAGTIEGDATDDDLGEEVAGADTQGTMTGTNKGFFAARRLEDNADADAETDLVSGADTRDTTAFQFDPLLDGTRQEGDSSTDDLGDDGEDDDADAPPTDGDTPPAGDDTGAAPTDGGTSPPARKRRASGSKPS